MGFSTEHKTIDTAEGRWVARGSGSRFNPHAFTVQLDEETENRVLEKLKRQSEEWERESELEALEIATARKRVDRDHRKDVDHD